MINSPGAISIYPQSDRLAERIGRTSLLGSWFHSELKSTYLERDTLTQQACACRLCTHLGQQVPKKARHTLRQASQLSIRYDGFWFVIYETLY